MTCTFAKLSGSIAKNCQNIVPGIKERIYLINYDEVDFDSCTFNSTNELIVESIVLKSTSPSYSAFYLDGQQMSNGKEAVYSPSKYMVGHTHAITAFIFDNDPIAKKRFTELANGKFLAIVENNYNNTEKSGTPSDSLWEVYGWDSGLYMTEGGNNNADAQGGWYLKLATAADAKESNVPYTVFVTDASSTRVMIEGLL